MPPAAIEAIYEVIGASRDVRRGFLPDALPVDLLRRLLRPAHMAPSVGLMQPWRFIVIEKEEVRAQLAASFERSNRAAAAAYEGERSATYAQLKLEALREAPTLLAVTTDIAAPRGHGLGRSTWPETAQFSTVAAIQNLWLDARAEGVGVGWVSILDKGDVREALALPDKVEPTAILCLGFVDHFEARPELETAGWEQRLPADAVVCRDAYDGPSFD